MRACLARRAVDLVVPDLMLPGEDGLSALGRMQRVDGAPPVIMLSAVGGDVDRIIGLELGAEDYLAKPCKPHELLARIRADLRTQAAVGATTLRESSANLARFEGWTADLVARSLHDPAGNPVRLDAWRQRAAACEAGRYEVCEA